MKIPTRRGATVIELLMEIVAPITGAIVIAILLKTLTSMPNWICVLISLVAGTLLGQISMIGALGLMGWVSKGKE